MRASESVIVVHAEDTGVLLGLRNPTITITLHDPHTGPRDVTVRQLAIGYHTIPGPDGPVWQPKHISYVLDDPDHPLAFASDEALQDPGQWPAGVEELVDAYRPEGISADG